MNIKLVAWAALLLCISPHLHAKLIHINDENQYNKELTDNKQTIVKFSAPWCSVCSGIEHPFEEIANEKEFQNVAFVDVNVDKFDNVSKQNGIVGVPTFVYVENGSKKIEEIGVQNMPSFKNHLRDNLRKTFKIAQNTTDMSMVTDQPVDITAESVAIDTTMPAPAVEPNIFMKIIYSIRDFFILIFTKIKEFFTTIVDAIKGFFGA
jgi:thioredoxin 1